MQSEILAVTIVSRTHVHKTVVSTKNCTGAFVKGKNELLNWVIATASKHDNTEEGSFQSMTRDCEDGSNSMFSFAPGSPQDVVLKILYVGHVLRTCRRFLSLQCQT